MFRSVRTERSTAESLRARGGHDGSRGPSNAWGESVPLAAAVPSRCRRAAPARTRQL